MNKQYTILSISISDCQEILGLNQYTPEYFMDAIFGETKTKPLSREAFKHNMRVQFERNVPEHKKNILDDVLNRIFDVCVSGRNEMNVDQFGKGIGVFTTKRLQNNPTKDLFFTLDREVKGVIGEKEITNYAKDAERRIYWRNITREIEDLKESVIRTQGSFELTYCGFYIWRKHPAIEALLQAYNQFQSMKSSTTPISYNVNFSDNKSSSNLYIPGTQVSSGPIGITNLGASTFGGVLQSRQTASLNSFDEFISLRNKLGFNTLNPNAVLFDIKMSFGHLDELRLDEFISFFCNFFRGRYTNYYEFVAQLTRLFEFLDMDNNGILDVGEFMHTIVHLFGGTEKEKIAAAFMVCDKDNSGFLDFKEVENLIFNTIRLTKKSDGDLAKIAYATALDLFNTIDLNKDDKISFEEFMSWYSGSLTPEEKEGLKQIRVAKIEELKKRGVHPLTKEEQAEREKQLKEEEAAHEVYYKTVEELRELVAFDKIHVHTAVTLLLKMCPNRTCDYKSFLEFLRELAAQTNVKGKENITKVGLKLFNTLDTNRNGLLDIGELATGLGLLCGGNKIEKIKAGFDIFDDNNDGFLDFRETTNFFAGFFKIICQNPPESIKAYKPEHLGTALAIGMYEHFGVPLDGALIFDQFRDYFSC